MASSRAPLVVCVSHPAPPELDLGLLRELTSALARPVELVCAPYKETLALRRARRAPPPPEALRAAAPPLDDGLRSAYARSEALLALDLPPELVAAAARLRFVQAYSSGVEHFDLRDLARRGIALASAAGAGAPSIAEFALARLLEVWKCTREIEAMQRARRMRRVETRLLAGATLGIVGLGAIGSALALRARALGMRVLASRRSPARGDEPVDELVGPARRELLGLLARCDAVVLAVPDAADTRGLLDAEALRAMRPGAVLCNVARGSLVDEAALAEALRSGRLGAAILDVTQREPLPPEDPLWEAPNLYLSPHSAVSGEAYTRRVLELFAENLARYAAGEPLERIVAAPP